MRPKELTINVEGLSDRHIRALLWFVRKFIRGAKDHGDLAPGRKWTPDMLEEVVDKSFYEIFTLLDMEDANGVLSDEERIRVSITDEEDRVL